jgi:hypothetical protein
MKHVAPLFVALVAGLAGGCVTDKTGTATTETTDTTTTLTVAQAASAPESAAIPTAPVRQLCPRRESPGLSLGVEVDKDVTLTRLVREAQDLKASIDLK